MISNAQKNNLINLQLSKEKEPKNQSQIELENYIFSLVELKVCKVNSF